MDIDLVVLRSLEREKEISFDILVEAIEQALLTAYHKTPGAQPQARVELDRKSGHVTVFAAETDEVAMTTAQRGDAATGLLERTMRILHQKTDDEWLHANVVKEQMKRMDPVFNEKSLGHRSFTDFVTARGELVDMREEGQARLLRLKVQ